MSKTLEDGIAALFADLEAGDEQRQKAALEEEKLREGRDQLCRTVLYPVLQAAALLVSKRFPQATVSYDYSASRDPRMTLTLDATRSLQYTPGVKPQRRLIVSGTEPTNMLDAVIALPDDAVGFEKQVVADLRDLTEAKRKELP